MGQAVESEVLTQPPLRVRDIHAYAICESLSGILLCSMLVFSPWAFGTTEPWSIWVVNGASFALGACLLVKIIIRRATGYRPPQWRESVGAKQVTRALKPQSQKSTRSKTPYLYQTRSAVLTRALVALTFLLLAYSFVAAINARATFDHALLAFKYHDYVPWLPHSLESNSTWEISWRYLALACAFWAARDWLMGKSAGEQRPGVLASALPGAVVPGRARLLLLVVVCSSGMLSIEGITQRLLNSPKLLFLVQPQIHQTAETQFASYAYRANAGQYFNLLWPVSLGFWWLLHVQNRNTWSKGILLLSTGAMVACPVVTGARGAAFVDVAMLLTAGLGLSLLRCAHKPQQRAKIASSSAWQILFLVGALTLGASLSWRQFRPRLEHLKPDLLQRAELYDDARLIARDFPVFGTGPGTFEQVFQLYRPSPQAYWPAQLHNDWLETRITFGRLGTGLIVAALGIFLLCCFSGERLPGSSPLAFCLWLSIAGCLAQARWDFPLQIYSIQLLLAIWCALLLTISGRKCQLSVAEPYIVAGPRFDK